MPAGLNTGPSFLSRLGAQLPGMTSNLAQNYGDPRMSGMVQGSSALLNRSPRNRGNPQGPRVRSGPPPQLPGQQMPLPTMPPMMGGGIDTGPTMMPQMPFDMSSMMQGPMMGGSPYGPTSNPGMGGLFGRFNRLSGPGQTPFGMRY